MNERRNVPEIVIVICELLRRSQTRINLLFTMSEIPHARPVKDNACEVMFRGRLFAIGSSPSSPFGLRRARFVFGPVAAPRVAEGEAWWSQTGSNRRPHACKARALPAELWPRTRRRMLAGMPSRSSRQPARLRPLGYGVAAFVQEGLPSRSCRAAKAGGPGKTSTSALTLIKRAL